MGFLLFFVIDNKAILLVSAPIRRRTCLRLPISVSIIRLHFIFLSFPILLCSFDGLFNQISELAPYVLNHPLSDQALIVQHQLHFVPSVFLHQQFFTLAKSVNKLQHQVLELFFDDGVEQFGDLEGVLEFVFVLSFLLLGILLPFFWLLISERKLRVFLLLVFLTDQDPNEIERVLIQQHLVIIAQCVQSHVPKKLLILIHAFLQNIRDRAPGFVVRMLVSSHNDLGEVREDDVHPKVVELLNQDAKYFLHELVHHPEQQGVVELVRLDCDPFMEVAQQFVGLLPVDIQIFDPSLIHIGFLRWLSRLLLVKYFQT